MLLALQHLSTHLSDLSQHNIHLVINHCYRGKIFIKEGMKEGPSNQSAVMFGMSSFPGHFEILKAEEKNPPDL